MAGNSSEDPTILLMLLIGIFCGILWGAWYFFHPQFLDALRYVRLVEFAIPALVNDQYSACFSWLRHAEVGNNIPSQQTYDAALGCFGAVPLSRLTSTEAMAYYNISVESLSFVSHLLATYLRWIAIGICGGLGYYAFFHAKKNKFKTRHNLETFIKAQTPIWPVISPIMDFNPSTHSARILGQSIPEKTPLFAEPFAPEEWLSYHRIPVVNGVPDREATRRAFSSQLGPRWTGFMDLPPYIQVICAALAMKGVQKREESDEFLGRIAKCWSAKGGYHVPPELVKEVHDILKDPAVGGVALAVAEKHAYRTTALLGLLKWARFMGGVLAAAQFLWLRGVDRELWYALNNLGRRSFHSEGAGAMAHFMAEEQAQKALPIPRMDTAIVTLNIYMGGDLPIQIPPREEQKRL
ncbi:MAG: hypothetical protein PHD48_09220 [Alphaproteobacteria bacterium]|nr:hypothetical protein [Alphaproteobacteria bacterium]